MQPTIAADLGVVDEGFAASGHRKLTKAMEQVASCAVAVGDGEVSPIRGCDGC